MQKGIHFLYRVIIFLNFIFLNLNVAIAKPAPNENYDNYFLISGNPSSSQIEINPLHQLQVYFSEIKSELDLLSWDHINTPLEPPIEKYDRIKFFGTWINDPRDTSSCLNTRSKVLSRDSLQPVSYNPTDPCAVQSGQWLDPYNQKTYLTPQEVEIDHFVPIKNVYISGAWKWDQRTRCVYTNFLGNRMHLIPISIHENRIKQDQTPEGYMPPDSSFRCEYLHRWLTVKLIWQLALNPNEAKAIQDYLKSESCDLSQFKVASDFINQQRKWISDNLDMCGK